MTLKKFTVFVRSMLLYRVGLYSQVTLKQKHSDHILAHYEVAFEKTKAVI